MKILQYSALFRKQASKLLKDIVRSQKTDKIIVFLGGLCEDDNIWRTEVKKEFGERIFFIDPYDEHWDPEDNIYDEIAGMLESDYVVFYKGGKGSKREKKFLDLMDMEYAEFTNIDKLKNYIERILKRVKTASITSQLDLMAEEIEKQDPKMALALDQLSDFIEKRAFYSPMGWLPGRGPRRMGPGRFEYNPGRRMPFPGETDSYEMTCPHCGVRVKYPKGVPCGCFRTPCPKCGYPQMTKNVVVR